VLFVQAATGFESSSKRGGLGLDTTASGAGDSTTLVLLVSPDQETRLAFARAFANLEVAIAPARAGH
jgi:hypothetical protein